MGLLAKINKMEREGLLPKEALQALINNYDPVVIVDRGVALVYPGKVLYPDLEKTGPASFNVTELECWRHPKQVEGVVEGNEIHDALRKSNLLAGCLGLAELEAMRKRGIVFFRKHFAGQFLFGWRDVVQYCDGRLNVPCLVEDEGKVVVNWYWLDCSWYSDYPALRFGS